MFLLPVLWVWLGGSGLVGVEGEGYYKIPIPSHPTNLLSSSVLLCRATKKTQPITGQNQLNTTSDLIPDSPFVSHPEAARVVQFPPNPRVGQSVYLYLDDIPNPTDCSWFRGKDHGYVFGPAYTGRETPGPNCSLRIENLNQDDSGTYTVTKDGPSVHGTGNHTSGLLPKPNMSTVQLFRENMDLVHLKCETTVKFANISWLQNGKPLSSCPRIQLSNNKQTLTIQPVLRHDAGAYQCQISNPFSAQRSDTTTISVICEYPLPGPSPFLVEFQDVWLYCDTTVTQDVSWFKDGNFFAKGRKLYIASVTRNNTGEYWCRVSNGITALDSDHVYLSVICEYLVSIASRSQFYMSPIELLFKLQGLL
uniref:Ig-like domain-containing protein n=1 Tax=Naja naja TaxID=35670 RepID=A0A8C6Y0W0_NAJNA